MGEIRMDNNAKAALTKNDAVQFYSIFEVMKITGLSRISIYRRIKDKTIRSIKFGSRVLIPFDFLDDLAEKKQAVLPIKEGKDGD